MDFYGLNYILAIAEHKNITKAAKSLYLSQPTLSKFLINVEKEIGQRLFNRVGNKYILTYAGEEYIKYAKEIINLKHSLDLRLLDIKKREIGVLNIAITRMRCTYMLPLTLPVFKKIYPNVKINILEGTAEENDKLLLDGKVDMSFYTKPENTSQFLNYETILNEEMLICLSKNHPLSRHAKPNPKGKYPTLDPRILKDELIIQLIPEQRTRQFTEKYFSSLNLKFDNILTTSSLPAAMELVSVGYGVSFMYETHIKHHHFENPIDLFSFGDPRAFSDFVVAYKRSSYLPECAVKFIEITKECFNKNKTAIN